MATAYWILVYCWNFLQDQRSLLNAYQVNPSVRCCFGKGFAFFHSSVSSFSLSSIPPSLPSSAPLSLFVRRVISLDLCVAAVSSNGVRLVRRRQIEAAMAAVANGVDINPAHVKNATPPTVGREKKEWERGSKFELRRGDDGDGRSSLCSFQGDPGLVLCL